MRIPGSEQPRGLATQQHAGPPPKRAAYFLHSARQEQPRSEKKCAARTSSVPVWDEATGRGQEAPTAAREKERVQCSRATGGKPRGPTGGTETWIQKNGAIMTHGHSRGGIELCGSVSAAERPSTLCYDDVTSRKVKAFLYTDSGLKKSTKWPFTLALEREAPHSLERE
ncbi:hypothetical protein DPEC_G00073200 [Dallia pectoralis]|uniref:Uncharacterized protein n=1 Tax=Dallia pectoralis TaxID=75939 RepID=A0ACC2H3L4_DALPE|nr:hypothetical protein DPEC_G00073200 [Dallia pectoralis]